MSANFINLRQSISKRENDEETLQNFGDEASFLLSVLYGIFILLITFVMMSAKYMSGKENEIRSFAVPSDCYIIALLSVSLLWLIFLWLSASNRRNQLERTEQIGSHHASNRWLKGVVALFGLAIAIKSGLELIAATNIDNPLCPEKVLLCIIYGVDIMFTTVQVGFLFTFSKLHIQKWKHITRFGIAHLIGANLSLWVSTVSDEIYHALTKTDDSYNTTTNSTLQFATIPGFTKGKQKLVETIGANCNKTPDIYNFINTLSSATETDNNDENSDGWLFSGQCACNTAFCKVVYQANVFLFPFMVEFCLVSSCLLYIMWQNTGIAQKREKAIIKPSFKFYKSYKGLGLGSVVIIATVIVITLLGTYSSGAASNDGTYVQGNMCLLLHNAFVVACDAAILITCALALYIYYKSEKKMKTNSADFLNSTLLYICLLGPLLVNAYSILSLSVEETEKLTSEWFLSLAYSIVDSLANVVQVLFIIYGLSRQPEIGTSKETQLRSSQEQGVDKNRSFTNPIAVDDVISRSDSVQSSLSLTKQDHLVPVDVGSKQQEENNGSLCDGHNRKMFLSLDDAAETTQTNNFNRTPSTNQCFPKHYKLSHPSNIRILLRDLLLFLVFANACLWVFLSLDGTAFTVYTYQYRYFGHDMWNTLTSVTKPFTVFFRMHAAACLFEVWSYS
ncbi:proton channel OTOP2-like [Clavelina lepadiformis]|uniref:proton channel OTOP2-like n=1 Tax=Clavelina lepadiformis TaxID=159417 RepID=UPI004041D977